jgi:hypothetical protein
LIGKQLHPDKDGIENGFVEVDGENRAAATFPSRAGEGAPNMCGSCSSLSGNSHAETILTSPGLGKIG